MNGGSQHPEKCKSGGHGPTLADEVEHLLPTPAVNDMGKAYTPEEWDAWTAKMKSAHGNGNGHGKSLEIEAARLLPTPTAARDGNSPSTHLARKPGRTEVTSLDVVLNHEASDPAAWGAYAPAIARWESITRPAPAPTEPTGKNGAHRLSPAFTEWMMGLPAGWLTDPAIWDGMTPSAARNAQLKACGNGVVPQQAAEATRRFLAWAANEARAA